MTEDILFDNIYVGHSPEDAKALAEETYEVKKALEKAKDIKEDEEEETVGSFLEDPVAFIRSKVLSFIELAQLDPVLAFKTQPETGAGLIGAAFTLFAMLGALFGLVGSQQKPITKVSFIQLQLVVERFTDVVLSDPSFRSPRRPMRLPQTTSRRTKRCPSRPLVGRRRTRAR